jgi:hypothetical protein
MAWKRPWSRRDELVQYMIRTLGLVGNARSADLLRGYADDVNVGPAAVQAIQEIERRELS